MDGYHSSARLNVHDTSNPFFCRLPCAIKPIAVREVSPMDSNSQQQSGTPSSGPTPFKPPSPGSISDVVEASGTARPGEIVSTCEANTGLNRNSIGRPLPTRPWEQQTYGSIYGGLLYGELARLVLRLLGIEAKPRKVERPRPDGLPAPPQSPWESELH